MTEFIAELKEIKSRPLNDNIACRIILDNCYITPEITKELIQLQTKEDRLVRVNITPGKIEEKNEI